MTVLLLAIFNVWLGAWYGVGAGLGCGVAEQLKCVAGNILGASP